MNRRSGTIWAGLALPLLVLLSATIVGARLTPAEVGLWASAIALLILLCLNESLERRRGERWGPLSLVLLQLSAGYGIGCLYFAYNPIGDSRLTVPEDSLVWASMLGALAAWATWIGYLASRDPLTRALKRTSERLALRVSGASTVEGIIVLEVFGWLGRFAVVARGQYFHIGDNVRSDGLTVISVALANLPVLAALVLATKKWQSGLTLRFVWVLIAIELAWALPSGTRASVVSLVVGLVILRSRCRRPLPRAAILSASVLCVAVLFPFAAAYRGNDSSYSRDPMLAARVAWSKTTSGGIQDMAETGIEATLGRFSDGLSAAVVHEGRSVDADSVGASLGMYLLSSPIPRALLPDKPNPGTFGNEFGRAYGLVRPNDSVTSIAVSQPLHFYMQSSWLGVLILMPLSGVLYRALECLVLGARSVVMNGLYGSMAFSIAASIGTILPLGLVGLVKTTLVSLIFLTLASWTAEIVGGARGTSRRIELPVGWQIS